MKRGIAVFFLLFMAAPAAQAIELCPEGYTRKALLYDPDGDWYGSVFYACATCVQIWYEVWCEDIYGGFYLSAQHRLGDDADQTNPHVHMVLWGGTDADHDGSVVQAASSPLLAGSAAFFNGRLYHKNIAGAYTVLPAVQSYQDWDDADASIGRPSGFVPDCNFNLVADDTLVRNSCSGTLQFVSFPCSGGTCSRKMCVVPGNFTMYYIPVEKAKRDSGGQLIDDPAGCPSI